MCLWQAIGIWHFEDVEWAGIAAKQNMRYRTQQALTGLLHANQSRKAADRNPASACDKLDKLDQLLSLKRADSSPEPLDLGRAQAKARVCGVCSKIIHIDIGKAADQELKLLHSQVSSST